MYAVIQTGGKQYRVQKGDVFDIENQRYPKIVTPQHAEVSDGMKQSKLVTGCELAFHQESLDVAEK